MFQLDNLRSKRLILPNGFVITFITAFVFDLGIVFYAIHRYRTIPVKGICIVFHGFSNVLAQPFGIIPDMLQLALARVNRQGIKLGVSLFEFGCIAVNILDDLLWRNAVVVLIKKVFLEFKGFVFIFFF